MASRGNVDLVNQYLEYARRERGRRPQTLYGYGQMLRSFVEMLGPQGVATSTADQMREWVHRPRSTDGLPVSPSSVKVRTSVLRSFFGWLHIIKELTQRNEALKLHIPTVHDEQPKPANDEHWRALWASDLSTGDRVAFGLAYFCGLRRGEAVRLAPWNFVGPMITNMERKGGKHGPVPYVSCARFFEQRRPDLIGGDADSFLGPLSELLQGREHESKLLPWRDEQVRDAMYVVHEMPCDFITPHTFNARLVRALERVGLDRAFSPHQLRHSFGTNMIAMGIKLIEVSRLMGHSSVAVTQRYVATQEDPFTELLDATVHSSSPWA